MTQPTSEFINILASKTYGNTPEFSLKGWHGLAKCVRVYDGDTAHFAFGFPDSNDHDHIYRFRCRMSNYNSAEIKSKSPDEREMAQKSKKALEDLILDKLVILDIREFDKYGRPLIIIETLDKINVNEFMVKNGYGKPYNGSGQKNY